VVVALAPPLRAIETPWFHVPVTCPEIVQFVVQVCTVKASGLLATPNTVTITLPEAVAPDGTVAVMLVEVQLVTVAMAPLIVTVPDTCDCDGPKLDPVMMIDDPTPAVSGLGRLMAGAASAVKDTVLLVKPVPPSFEVIALVVLVSVPPLKPPTLTLTLKVHDPPADSVPPVKLSEVEPALAEIIPAPHEPLRPLGVNIARLVWNVSVKPTPVSGEELGLLMVKLSEVDPVSGIMEAPKAFVIVGGATTVSVAVLLVGPVPVWVEEIAPVVLGLAPVVVPVTLILNVHEAPAASVALEMPTEIAPADAVGATLQVLLFRTNSVETTSPAGNGSLKVRPVRVTVVGLLMVKLNEVVPLSGIVEAPKPLLIVGFVSTVRVPEAVPPVPPLVSEIGPVVLT